MVSSITTTRRWQHGHRIHRPGRHGPRDGEQPDRQGAPRARVEPLAGQGGGPVAASIVKLGGNFMIMAVIEAMGEALALCEKYGVERQAMMDVMTGSIFNTPLYVNYGKLIAAHNYTPAGFKLALGFKDAN